MNNTERTSTCSRHKETLSDIRHPHNHPETSSDKGQDPYQPQQHQGSCVQWSKWVWKEEHWRTPPPPDAILQRSRPLPIPYLSQKHQGSGVQHSVYICETRRTLKHLIEHPETLSDNVKHPETPSDKGLDPTNPNNTKGAAYSIPSWSIHWLFISFYFTSIFNFSRSFSLLQFSLTSLLSHVCLSF